jgi:hypothetical protein
LRRIILENYGIIRVNAFCKQYKCDKKTLASVIKRFEEEGLIYTISSGMEGRKLSLAGGTVGGTSVTGCIYTTRGSSSSSYLNNKLQLQLQGPGGINTPSGGINPTGGINTPSEGITDSLSLDTDAHSKFEKLPSWEKARMIEQAEELFYIGMAARLETGAFSAQTLSLYVRISQKCGRDHSAALFLFLLPKAKDNPTGYILSAWKQGAEPPSDLIVKVQKIWSLLSTLTKASKSQEVKTQIMNAMERGDMEAVAMLTQEQMQIKTLLHELSWSGTVAQLIEKRDTFVSSFLKS